MGESMSDKIAQNIDRDGFEEGSYEEEAGSPPIAWTDYGPLTVAVTRSTSDGVLIVHIENTKSEYHPLTVRVAEASNESVLWEGLIS